jgi:hypothetical protein
MEKYVVGDLFPIPLVGEGLPEGAAVKVSYRLIRMEPPADPNDPNSNQIGEFEVQYNPSGKIGLPFPETVGRRSMWFCGWTIQDNMSGFHNGQQEFMIEAYETLVKGENSFQGYYEALMRTEDIPGIDAFKALSKQEQIAALINSWRQISSMTFMSKGKIIWDIGSLNATELDKLDPRLLEALCLAQILEANETMDSNSAHNKRLEGIMSETIGESSMMFRPGKVASNTVLSRRSMGFLRNYLVYTARITRV